MINRFLIQMGKCPATRGDGARKPTAVERQTG